MKNIIAYTDGACSGNPGPGGWGVVLKYGRKEKELSGAEPDTTNNRMELRAAIEALRALKEPCMVALHTDSNYIVKAMNEGWLNNWQRNGWKTASKKAVGNQDLWKELLEVIDRHQVRWIKVKGHSNNVLNDRVDQLAVRARETL